MLFLLVLFVNPGYCHNPDTRTTKRGYLVYTYRMWWEPFTFQENQWYCWRLAGAEIFVCRSGKTWRSCCRSLRWEKRDALCTGPLQEEPADQDAVQTNVLSRKTAALRPYLPKKPFLINTGKLNLFPGTKITLELQIPPLLHLSAEKNENAHDHIFDFSPFTLKETWYGKNSMEGFVCFTLPVNAQNKSTADSGNQDMRQGSSCSLEVRCSMTIRNKTKKLLELNAVPLYTAGLSVYEKNQSLISDAPVIDALENDFHMSIESAKSEHGVLLTCGNRNDPGLIQHGTRIIKNITGL